MLKRKFKKHMEAVHGEKDIEIFHCKCQFETFSQEALDTHVESCTTINKVTCDMCDKKMTKFQYKRHVETVHGVAVGEEKIGKFECEECHKEYKNLDTLRQHKKIKRHMEYAQDNGAIDQEELVKYKCEECDKEYEAYSREKNHKVFGERRNKLN